MIDRKKREVLSKNPRPKSKIAALKIVEKARLQIIKLELTQVEASQAIRVSLPTIQRVLAGGLPSKPTLKMLEEWLAKEGGHLTVEQRLARIEDILEL